MNKLDLIVKYGFNRMDYALEMAIAKHEDELQADSEVKTDTYADALERLHKSRSNGQV